MKKRILAIAVMAIMTVTMSFANADPGTENVSKNVETSFKKEFVGAVPRSWTKSNDLYKVQFVLNEQIMFAYFNKAGALLGVYRNVTTDQIPLLLANKLKDKYSSYWITSLFEAVRDGESNYYVSLENADEQLTLISDLNADWALNARFKK